MRITQIKLDGAEEHYDGTCQFCGKHFDFDFNEEGVDMRPLFWHLAHDHGDEVRIEVEKARKVKR